jgi:phage-related protein
MGYDLSAVQYGAQPPSSKPWRGLGGGVWELVENDASGTYRAVYTVQFARAIYVLHAFQKKSPSGVRTARTDIALIMERQKAASKDYETRYGKKED